MRRCSVLFAIALLGIIAVGCSSGGDDGAPTITSPTTTPEVLDGTFQLQQIRVQGNGTDVTLTPPAVTGTVVVTSDGRFTATIRAPEAGVDGTWSGDYTVSGDTLTLNYDDGSVEVWTISPDRTTVSSTFSEDGFNVTPTFALA